ncbi:MAG: aspartate aminotransferase family protein [Candidatus Omnitrophica bacterium]|jgi:acetylornithine/N-succinyldiaminopimelate aminotransferase|nr:aspartate aminotransferase family protein [Candidatus Omnitrophota bacterium]MDD3274203.1 aspartate aminotransferase family protein [Candidatus Omnitrophota bacterium]MDD5078008.1 aspartate aminotransferase family protein [Candidatus Omnitrophota bacterium]
MKLEEIFQTYRENIQPTYNKIPLVFVKGKGSKLWDLQGKVYLDFFPGWGVGSLGHCHPKVMQGVRDQIGKLIFVPNNYYHPFQAKLAKELIYLSFPGKVFFANSGAEANEAAIKLARKFGSARGRYEIITFENAFHGRTLAALAATGQKKYQAGFEPIPEGFKQVKFNDLEAVKNAVGEKTAAIMLELVQGEGGVNPAGKDFVLGLRKICDENKILLIIDEVQTGIGRTGRMFCYQGYGIIPDVMTLAKALGGGLPIGAMIAKKEFADLLTPGTHASTFGGGPVICRAALGVLKAMDKEKVLNNCRKTGDYLLEKLSGLKDKYPVIKEVRGIGLMLGVELNIPGKQIVQDAMERGLLINCTHDNVLRLMPALNITLKEAGQGFNILKAVLKNL